MWSRGLKAERKTRRLVDVNPTSLLPPTAGFVLANVCEVFPFGSNSQSFWNFEPYRLFRQPGHHSAEIETVRHDRV